MFVCAECGSRSEQAGPCHREGAARLATDDAFLGMEVGPYHLARLLGRGGMGRVYLGVQPAVGGRVAIKLLSDDACEKPSLIERFFTEARAVNLINHEGIARVFDFTETPTGRPAIVMELVEGKTLREIIRAGKVPLGGLVQVMIEVLSALTAAHDIGIIHRDLKPDNIIVTPSGRAKVLDFGIAKLAADLPGAGPSTRSGAMLGTPHYMSPEQIGRGTVDGRSDVYSAGVVLFEAITGQKPFEGLGHFDLLVAQVERQPPSPRTLRPDLPEALASVVQGAMAKQRGERFASASALANALHAASAELPAHEWRSLAPHRRPLTRSATPPASIAPLTLPTGQVGPPVRKAAPYDVTDRPGARDAPGAGPEPGPPVAGRADGAPPAGTPDRGARAATSAEQRRQAPTVPVTAKRRSRLIVPVVAACAGGLVVALVGRMLGPSTPAPAPAPPVAVVVEGQPHAGSADGRALPPPLAPPSSPDAPPTSASSATSAPEPAPARPTSPSSGQAGPPHQRSPSPGAPVAGRPTGRSPAPAHVGPAGEPPVTTPSGAPGVDAATTAGLVHGAFPNTLSRPIDFDPHRFDPAAYLPKARAMARTLVPDGELTMMLFSAVSSDGFVDFDFMSFGGNASYMFRSPTRSQRKPGVPVNAPLPDDCGVVVTVTRVNVAAMLSSHGCTYEIVTPPRCTPHDVWQAALAHGAADHRLASIAWMHSTTSATGQAWYFDSMTPGQPGGTQAWYEDCATASAPPKLPPGP